MKQLALDIAAPAVPTLDNFVAGRNAELVERLRGLVAGRDGERFVYVWGDAGCGRSHLLAAVTAGLRGAGQTAIHVHCGEGTGLPGDAAAADAVALDDVDRLNAPAQLDAFHLYNALRERGGTLIASGSAPPVQLALRPDLLTRLAWGLVYQVTAPTDEDQAAAIDERARFRGFRLAPEVRDFVLSHAPRDIGSLLRLIDELDRRSLEGKRPVTVPMVRELLAATAARRAVREPACPEGAT